MADSDLFLELMVLILVNHLESFTKGGNQY